MPDQPNPMDDVVEALFARAKRLHEAAFGHLQEGNGRPALTTTLAHLWLKAVTAAAEEFNIEPEVKALAKEMARANGYFGDSEMATSAAAAPAAVCRIPPYAPTGAERHVVAVAMSMGGAVPLWVHYVQAARDKCYENLPGPKADLTEENLLAALQEIRGDTERARMRIAGDMAAEFSTEELRGKSRIAADPSWAGRLYGTKGQ